MSGDGEGVLVQKQGEVIWHVKSSNITEQKNRGRMTLIWSPCKDHIASNGINAEKYVSVIQRCV